VINLPNFTLISKCKFISQAAAVARHLDWWPSHRGMKSLGVTLMYRRSSRKCRGRSVELVERQNYIRRNVTSAHTTERCDGEESRRICALWPWCAYASRVDKRKENDGHLHASVSIWKNSSRRAISICAIIFARKHSFHKSDSTRYYNRSIINRVNRLLQCYALSAIANTRVRCDIWYYLPRDVSFYVQHSGP